MKAHSFVALTLLATTGLASSSTITIYSTLKSGKDMDIGKVRFTDTAMGLLIEPNLTQLPVGLHGFHLHEHPSCADMGNAAMGHLDPNKTGKHLGPFNAEGHLGDLPALYVDRQGSSTLPMIAPRLKVSDLNKHAIMIHAGADNYSDTPEKLGGGGDRIACGVAK